MTRDPSDGTIRADVNLAGKSAAANQSPSYSNNLISTSTSGLPVDKMKADELKRLERSRDWLKGYFKGAKDEQLA